MGRYFKLAAALAWAAASPLLLAAGEPPPAAWPSLDAGYRQMYNLQFEESQRQFLEWQRLHPEDPLGPVSEAASLLFSEFDRLGVLEAQFYVQDSAFKARKSLPPNPAVRERFDAALNRAEQLAQRRYSADAGDADALFALALVNGLHADYAALIEKRNMAALGYTKRASRFADHLLAISPGYSDAYLATGIGKYIVGTMAAPVRWFLSIAGYSSDKEQGLRELRMAARDGRYLAPFARILLAIAALRDQDRQGARELLVGLRDEFPANPLFAREIARIDHPSE